MEGENNILVTASDQVGNSSEKTISVFYEPPNGQIIEIVGGQNQRAMINDVLLQPLTVRVVEADGSILEGAKVVFRVAQGSGFVNAGSTKLLRAVVVTSDVNGDASTSFQLGQRVGAGNQKVTASVAGVENKVTFYASTDGQLADKLNVSSGNYQRSGIFQPLYLHH